MEEDLRLNDFFDALETNFAQSSHVFIANTRSPPWLTAYAWISDAPWTPQQEPQQCANSESHLFIGVRNPTLREVLVEFSCSPTVGKVLIAHSDADHQYNKTFTATPHIAGVGATPAIRSSPLRVTSIADPIEVIRILVGTTSDEKKVHPAAAGFLHIVPEIRR